LKRVEYLQTPDYQSFKKIQLAFNHVCIPLKSELNFGKLLIINNLAKSDSLQSCRPVFHPIAIKLLLEQLTINNLQKQGWIWVLHEAPKSELNFGKSLIINTL